MAENKTHPNQKRSSDRKLGDEWRDWDGVSTGTTEAGKRLFFFLCFTLLILVGTLGLFSWYLVTPRIAEWHHFAPNLLLGTIVALILVSYLALATMVFFSWMEWPLPFFFRWLAQKLLLKTEKGVLALGNWLSINSDKTSHSLIRVHNALIPNQEAAAVPSEVLVLLPRCLQKKQLQEAKSLASSYHVHLSVVPGGELARKRIMEYRPKTVIGVACERDLLSGIREVGNKAQVIGIPNTRPDGPCKNTVIDMDELKKTIALWS